MCRAHRGLLDLDRVFATRVPRLEAVQQHAGVTRDDREKIVKVVSDASSELTDCVHLLRMVKLLLEAALVREIAQRVDDQAWRERRGAPVNGADLSVLSLDANLSA